MRVTRISPVLLRQAASVVEDLLGIALTSSLSRHMEEAVVRSAGELGMEPDGFVSRLRAGDPRCAATMTERTVVRETYFGRYPEQLSAVVRQVIEPALPDRPLRAWSAGCATGEEAYELGMALLAAGRRRGLDRIVATDASEEALRQARAAEYGERSVRRLDAVTRGRFLGGGRPPFVVAPEVRELVEFRRSNLVRDAAPSEAFDLVLCRNVLIYFTPQIAAAVLRGLAAALRPGGFLALGPAEAPLASGLPLEWVGDASFVLLRRVAADAEARATPPEAARSPRVPERPRAAAGRSQRRRPERPQKAVPKAVPPRPREAPVTPLDAAREAARSGDVAEAERLAREASASSPSPEPYLLLAMAAEARGELAEALALLRRALYLEPRLAVAHASMAALHRRMGSREEARRARRNALRALEGVEDGALLPGVERMTAGALRQALEHGGLAS